MNVEIPPSPPHCISCRHWEPFRTNAGWGKCLKIGKIAAALANVTKAYIFATAKDGTELADVTFQTRDIFSCLHHEARQTVHPNTLVQMVQQASRDHNKIVKKGEK